MMSSLSLFHSSTPHPPPLIGFLQVFQSLSGADCVDISYDDIIAELETATVSERQGRAIDRDQSGSMEKKKREGYF